MIFLLVQWRRHLDKRKITVKDYQREGKLTEDGEESEEADYDGDGEKDQHQGVQLVGVILLVQGVGGHRVVVVVKVPGGDGLLVRGLRYCRLLQQVRKLLIINFRVREVRESPLF